MLRNFRFLLHRNHDCFATEPVLCEAIVDGPPLLSPACSSRRPDQHCFSDYLSACGPDRFVEKEQSSGSDAAGFVHAEWLRSQPSPESSAKSTTGYGNANQQAPCTSPAYGAKAFARKPSREGVFGNRSTSEDLVFLPTSITQVLENQWQVCNRSALFDSLSGDVAVVVRLRTLGRTLVLVHFSGSTGEQAIERQMCMVQGRERSSRDFGGRRKPSFLWLFLARVWGWLRAAWRVLTAASGPFALGTWSSIVQDLARARLAAPVWVARPCVPPGEHRVAIVTGGNTGIGFETVRGLWLAGYHVVLACRSEARGEAARARLLDGPENSKELADGASLTVMPLDLNRFDAVVNFASLFRKHWNSLHILVLNAGIMSPGRYEETADGYEAHLGVNHLAQYLLVRLLEDLLRQSQGRVILVSSILALLADEMRWHGAQWPKPGRWPFMAYGWSKAYNYICALELQRRGLDALCVHPGGVHTEVTRRLPSWLQRANDFVASWMLRTPAEGAATVLWACFAEVSVSPEACHQGSKATQGVRSPYRAGAVSLKSAERQALITDAGRRLLQMPSWMRAPSTGQQLWSLSEQAVQPYLVRAPNGQADALTSCRHST